NWPPGFMFWTRFVGGNAFAWSTAFSCHCTLSCSQTNTRPLCQSLEFGCHWLRQCRETFDVARLNHWQSQWHPSETIGLCEFWMTSAFTPTTRPPVSDSLISVVVPLYNEADVLVELCQRLRAALIDCRTTFEIIFVDDGSRDKTAETLDTLAEQFEE